MLGFFLSLVLLCMLFLHIFQFGKLPGSFPIHLIQEMQSYDICSKNSTHQSMQRALCPQMHTALALVFM